jgi:hypothetical protein
MKKFWGWMFFLFAVLVIRVTQMNFIGSTDNINWFIAITWWILGVASLFGWYRLAILKNTRKVK